MNGFSSQGQPLSVLISVLVLSPAHLIRSSIPLGWGASNFTESTLLQACVNILTQSIHTSFFYWLVREAPKLALPVESHPFLILPPLTLSGDFCVTSSAAVQHILNFSSANSIYSSLYVFIFVVRFLMKLLSNISRESHPWGTPKILSIALPVSQFLLCSFRLLSLILDLHGDCIQLLARTTAEEQWRQMYLCFWVAPVCLVLSVWSLVSGSQQTLRTLAPDCLILKLWSLS